MRYFLNIMPIINEFKMKLMYKCGNIEDIKTDVKIERFEFRNCGYGTTALVCKNCSEIVYIKIKNS